MFIFGRMLAYGMLFVWFDPFYHSQYFFSQVMSGWLLLDWTDTKQDLMCLACHVFFLQSSGHLLGKDLPLGSRVCDDFLCLYHLPTLCPGSCGTCLYPFLTFALFFTLLKDNVQFHMWGSNLQPLYLDSNTLPLNIALAYCVVIMMKVSDYSYDLGVKGLGQIYLTNVGVNFFFIFVRGWP